MAVIIQTAAAGSDFDGTPGRGFVDLVGATAITGTGVTPVNTSRRVLIGAISVNCIGGTITTVRVALAVDKAGADGIDLFSYLVTDTNAMTQWTLRGPILVPNGYSLFVYSSHSGPPNDCRLLVSGGVVSQSEGFSS